MTPDRPQDGKPPREPYVPPTIEQVELRPEEVLLSPCTPNYLVGSGSPCSPANFSNIAR